MAPITSIEASAYTVPTDAAEADGTLAWDSTTLVLVHATAGGQSGIGYSYTHACVLGLIRALLGPALQGKGALDVARCHQEMERAVRNLGRDGLAATAVSAIDIALWDLKARLLGLPLHHLLGALHERVAIYGSGGFTSYDDAKLAGQLAGWVEDSGCRAVKMKIGSRPEEDPRRMRAARAAIGDAALFVDANGAFAPTDALNLAMQVADLGVRWFEEPCSSDDLAGLALLRRRLPPGMALAAGEYGYDIDYFRRMLAAGAVDVQQADVTRCGGITGWLRVAALCAAHHTPLSAHCAPALHLHVACATPGLRHLEWFHDHARIERILFDGAARPRDGQLAPDATRPGLGLEFRAADAERYRVG